MAKKAVRKSGSKVPEHCHTCGETDCNCRKINGSSKVLMALALLGYAAGMLSLQLAAGVVGVLVGLAGFMLLKKH